MYVCDGQNDVNYELSQNSSIPHCFKVFRSRIAVLLSNLCESCYYWQVIENLMLLNRNQISSKCFSELAKKHLQKSKLNKTVFWHVFSAVKYWW